MIRQDKRNLKNGIKTYIRVTEGYRPSPGAKPKQRTVKSFGYLEDQDDPKAFMKEVEEFNKGLNRVERIVQHYDMDEKMNDENNRIQNYGYMYLNSIYNILKIDEFVDSYVYREKLRIKYDLKSIIRYLVIQRIMNPASKRRTLYEGIDLYEFCPKISYDELCRSLDIVSSMGNELQAHTRKALDEFMPVDHTYAYYDLTNYFFEIDCEDEAEEDLRHRGVSKEHRVDPIVELSLVMDANGCPLQVETHPGNTSESTTVIPVMNKVKETLGLQRLILVADKGLNTTKNIDYLQNNGDGYVFSQIVKGTRGRRFLKYIEDKSDWTVVSHRYRFRLFTEEFNGKDENGNAVIRKRKVLLYWTLERALRDQHKREEKICKANKADINKVYGLSHGYGDLFNEHLINKQTGEVLENTKRIKTLNEEKIESLELYDGVNCIITGELDYDENKIREVYGNLWMIEDAFRISKTNLSARPVFLQTKNHINAHFLLCFMSVLILRIIKFKMGNDHLTVERLQKVLNKCNLIEAKHGLLYFLPVLRSQNIITDKKLDNDDNIECDFDKLQRSFNTSFEKKYLKKEDFKNIMLNMSIA